MPPQSPGAGSRGGCRILVVAVGIERAAGAERVVEDRGKDDAVVLVGFRHQVGAHADFDPRAEHLDHDARIDLQPTLSRPVVPNGPPGSPVNSRLEVMTYGMSVSWNRAETSNVSIDWPRLVRMLTNRPLIVFSRIFWSIDSGELLVMIAAFAAFDDRMT